MPAKTISAAGAEHYVVDEGQGLPLVLLHGFPLSHDMWRGQIEGLAQHYRVIAPDLRGFGSSTVTEGTLTMERYADDLAAMLAALIDGEPAVLCGLSMGGYVAWQFWKRHAVRLRALVLCDTRAAGDAPEARQTRLKMAEQVLELGSGAAARAMLDRFFARATTTGKPELVERVRQTIAATDPRGIAAAQRGMADRPDVRSWLPSILTPALLIVGSEDVISPPAEMAEMARAMPRARLVEIADAGHMAPLEQPAAVNAAILEFLAGVA